MRSPLRARCAALLAGATLLAGTAWADAPLPEVPPAAPERIGYAFDYPRVLAQQRLFGIAHGISLLAAACLDVPETTEEIQGTYGAWRERQQETVDAAIAELSAYYHGDTESASDWLSLARTLRLKEEIGYAPDSVELKAACATLSQALAQPRYDLRERIRLEELMARTVAAVGIEARNGYCRGLFADDMRTVHDARHAVWLEINRPLMQEAAATLARDWPADAPAATFADWLAELRRETTMRGSPADCIVFSATLKQPETALRNAFNLPPPRPK